MKNKEITIQIGRTYNLNNYRSARIDVGIKATDKTKEEIMKEVVELANFVKQEMGLEDFD